MGSSWLSDLGVCYRDWVLMGTVYRGSLNYLIRGLKEHGFGGAVVVEPPQRRACVRQRVVDTHHWTGTKRTAVSAHLRRSFSIEECTKIMLRDDCERCVADLGSMCVQTLKFYARL